MAKQEVNKEKVVTPAQGAEGAIESGNVGTNVYLTETGDLPEWVSKLLASNQAVIESNQTVIQKIDEFNEGASDVVREIVETATASGEGKLETKKPEQPKSEVKVNKKAKYVVRKGKRFASKENPAIIYGEGDDVTGLATKRLQTLLERGIIEEAKN